MNEFQVLERNRAFARAMEHLRAAHAHLVQAAGENHRFDLGLDLPEKALLDAAHRCAHAYRACPELGEGQPPEKPA